MREKKGLNPGFTRARCLQGAGKECGRCKYIKEWDGLAIPDLRPGAARDAWVALLRYHMIRRRVGGKVQTPHIGGLSPWEWDAYTGRSLKSNEGVVFLTSRQASQIVKKHNDLYKEWLKKIPNNN
ncbi:unnamed protein product [Ectocarpus sp. CCAP 1310/34]|nr:unnamed protein product [Ectocarpus sp. CCAP 1310/34]